jgi:hypothetical protein
VDPIGLHPPTIPTGVPGLVAAGILPAQKSDEDKKKEEAKYIKPVDF